MRIEQLTFTRFIAALAIVIYHFGAEIFPFNNDNVRFLVKNAHVGVSYFFVLSGFIMIVAYNRLDKINAADYLKNRFARVYPLMAISVIPYLFALFLFPGKVKIWDIFLNLFTIQAWIPGKATAGNYPLWSLTVEIFFYVCFPFLINKIYKKYSLTNVAVCVVLVWAVSIGLQFYLENSPFYEGSMTPSHDLIYYFPPMHLNQFLIGNLAGLAVVNQAQGVKRRYDVLVLIPLIIIGLFFKYPFGVSYHNGFLAWFFAAFIILFAQNTGIITKIFSVKPLVFLGEISFAMYILQAPVFETSTKLIEKLKLTDNTSAIFYFNLVLLLAVSAFCHIYVELPLRNRIKNIRLKPVLKES